MTEKSLVRLVQSFKIKSNQYESKIKISALIRKTYEVALGLIDGTSMKKVLAFGVHNTMKEIIAEA